MSDMKNWPLVPVDPACVPEGHEAVSLQLDSHRQNESEKSVVRFLIIRPIPKPIRLPLAIVPSGWWVARNEDSSVWVFETQPPYCLGGWGVTGQTFYRLPPWIAAQLPREWHDLPWDQSAVQQQEGGDT